VRSEPQWASKARVRASPNPPALYIGPWQEFALNRALSRRPAPPGEAAGPYHLPPISHRPASTSVASSAAGPSNELQQFVAAFKEAAEQMDEEGASNLLRWSPLFLPTVQTLMQPPSRLGTAAHAAGAASTRTSTRPSGGSAPSVQQQKKASVRAQRERHITQMRALYSFDADSDAGAPVARAQASSSIAPAVASQAQSGVRNTNSYPSAASAAASQACNHTPAALAVSSRQPQHTDLGLRQPMLPVITVSPGKASSSAAKGYGQSTGGEGASQYLREGAGAYGNHTGGEGAHPPICMGGEASAPRLAESDEPSTLTSTHSVVPSTLTSSSTNGPTHVPGLAEGALPTTAFLPDIGDRSRYLAEIGEEASFLAEGNQGARRAVGSRGPVSRSGSVSRLHHLREADEWENEVDDLIEWTRALPGIT